MGELQEEADGTIILRMMQSNAFSLPRTRYSMRCFTAVDSPENGDIRCSKNSSSFMKLQWVAILCVGLITSQVYAENHVVVTERRTKQPAEGYEWRTSAEGDYRIVLKRDGTPHEKYSHVVYNGKGGKRPADGYD